MEDRTRDIRTDLAEERVVDSREMVRVSVPHTRHAMIVVLVLIMPVHHSRDHISIYTLHGEPLFFQHFDGPFYPTLRLLHKCMRSIVYIRWIRD